MPYARTKAVRFIICTIGYVDSIRASLQERAYADDPDTVEMDTEVNEVLRAGLDALDAHESSPVVHIERVDAPSPEAIATLPPSDP